jgi:hypothetical protein
MKKTYFILQSSLLALMFGLLVLACKKDDAPEDPTFTINGRYKVTSATFNPALANDPDGPGAATTTNALPFIEIGLFGASLCDPKTAANTILEFADNLDVNLRCVNNAASVFKLCTWSFASGTITLASITVPNPVPPPATVTLPQLPLTDVTATSTTTLKFKATIPLTANPLGPTGTVDFVLEKQP